MRNSQDIEIVVKAKSNLTKKEKERLNSLTLRSGIMWSYFVDYDNSITVLALDEDKQICGWLLAFLPDEESDWEGHIYISRFRRREGIGTKIMETALNIFGTLQISKWSEEAGSFYSNFDNTEEIP